MKRRSVEGSRIFLRTRINHGTSSRSVFGAEKEEDKRDDERRRWSGPKFHAPPLPFSPVDACACYGHHAAPPPPPRPGEMITTPNRLRGERRSTRVARVDKEVADGAKGVLKLAAKRPGPRFSRVSFLCPIFLKSRHEEGEQLALRQSVSCASLTLSSSLPPIALLPLCLSLPSFAIPPRHALSLSLLLCFCNLFVSASSAFLFSPPSPPSFLCETVLVRARVVGLLPNLPRTHTAACRCISLAGERWAP